VNRRRLRRPRVPRPTSREWLAPHPAWIEIRKSPSPDAALADLDAGEAAAIALAALETDVLLLIDESAGRLEASRRGIANTGTLGVLRRADIERKRQSNGIYAQASFGAEVEAWWHREGSIASIEVERKRIS
jgi:hypothetical protein